MPDHPPSVAGSRRLPYLLIALVCTFCHGFILTNDGPIWDGWYWHNWLTNKSWPAMVEYTGAQGLPYTLWAFAPFAYLPNMIVTGMWASFLCMIVEGILIFELALRLAPLTRAEALALTLLALALPFFSAAQDFPVFGLIVFRMMFLGAALMATVAVETKGIRHWLLRALALAGFYFSCVTNGALIVYYGGFYLLLLLRDWREKQTPLVKSARRFIFRYPDLFLVPPAVFAARVLFIPQFGWYENYNTVRTDLGQFTTNLWSFFENVFYFHAEKTLLWPLEHLFATALLIAAFFLCGKYLPAKTWGRRSEIPGIHFAWFGAFLLFLAIFPLAIAGKHFDPNPAGEMSRHSMLTPIPLAILLLGLFRWALFLANKSPSRWMVPSVGCAIVLFGSQIPPVYLSERVEWIFSRSLLHNATKNPVVRDSSVVVVRDFSAVRQIIYGTAAFATAFGELSRLLVQAEPRNGPFFLPFEIHRIICWMTIVPNEFRRINPAGAQVRIEAERKRGGASDLSLAMRYLRLRWFGTTAEMDDFLSSLCTLRTTVLRPATPLPPGPPRPEPEHPPATVRMESFTNGAGIQLIYLPGGWWAAQCETSQAEYTRVMNANPSLFQDPTRPVECVSWNDAIKFCRRLTESERNAGRLPEGYIYRLPTADEFDRLLAEGSIANTVTSTREIQWHTQPVGSLPPNSLGLHDTVGNVWEWCDDWWDREQRMKVSKGGAWVNTIAELTPITARSDDTDWLSAATISRLHGRIRRDYPDQGFWDRGFRCILAPPITAIQIPLREVKK